MKNRWLLLSIFALLLNLINFNLLKIIISLIFFIYFFLIFRKGSVFIFLFIILFNCSIMSLDEKSPTVHQGYVEKIHKGFLEIRVRNDLVILVARNKDISIGDKISFKGQYEKIQEKGNRNIYGFNYYLTKRNINYLIKSNIIKIIRRSQSLCSRLYRHINGLNEKSRKQIKEIIYHIYETESENKQIDFLLYSSGIVFSYLITVLSKILKIKRSITAILICIIGYLAFGYAYYLLNIFIFNFVDLMLCNFNKKDKLGLSILMLLIIEHNCIYELSFIYTIAFKLFKIFNLCNTFMIYKCVILVIPIQCFFFNECNIIAILLLKKFQILSALIYTLTLASVFIFELSPILNILINIHEFIFQMVDFGFKIIGHPPLIWTITWFYYLFIFFNNEKLIVKPFIILLLLLYNISSLNPMAEITFINVGQGDCILIKEPFAGKTMLIDVAGKIGRNIPRETIYPVLKSKGIKSIDYCIITHDDYDHCGGLEDLKQFINIKKIYRKTKSISLDNIDFINLNNKSYQDKNDNSIVLYGEIYGMKSIFMGDAGKIVEQDIMDKYNKLEIDLLKVSHHGSKTGSDEDFINLIRPRFSIISAGVNNRYKHPHNETIKTLEKNESYIFNTQIDGEISFYVSNYLKFFKTNNKFGIIW